jgi:hypothetical protein
MGTRSFQKIVDDHAAQLARIEAAKAGRPIGTLAGRRVILMQAAEQGSAQCKACVFDLDEQGDPFSRRRSHCTSSQFMAQERAEFGQCCFKDRGYYVQA